MNKNAIYETSHWFLKYCQDIYSTDWQTNLKSLLVRFPIEEWLNILRHINDLSLNRILNINQYFNYTMSEVKTYENFYINMRKKISELLRKIIDFEPSGWQTGAKLMKEQFIKDLRECKLERIVND